MDGERSDLSKRSVTWGEFWAKEGGLAPLSNPYRSPVCQPSRFLPSPLFGVHDEPNTLRAQSLSECPSHKGPYTREHDGVGEGLGERHSGHWGHTLERVEHNPHRTLASSHKSKWVQEQTWSRISLASHVTNFLSFLCCSVTRANRWGCCSWTFPAL